MAAVVMEERREGALEVHRETGAEVVRTVRCAETRAADVAATVEANRVGLRAAAATVAAGWVLDAAGVARKGTVKVEMREAQQAAVRTAGVREEGAAVQREAVRQAADSMVDAEEAVGQVVRREV